MNRFFVYIFTAFVALGCTKEVLTHEADFTEGIVAKATDFEVVSESIRATRVASESEGAVSETATAAPLVPQTKTTVSTSGTFAWAEGDVIGVVPTDAKTYQTNFEIKSIGTNPKEAAFDGGAWKLKAGKEYAAYFPCQNMVLTSDGDIEMSFIDQKQASNGSLAHFGAFDYMYASAVSPVDGSATFAFKHKVSLVKVVIPVSSAGTYTSLALKSDSACFGKTGRMSLSDGSLTATSKSKKADLALSDITLGEGETLTAWMAVMPASGIENLSLSLTTSDGKVASYSIESPVNDFVAGKAYAIVAQKDSKVIFSDDFSWLSPFITDGIPDFVNGTYSTLKARIDDSNNNSPNLHSKYPDTFPAALAAAGYEDKAASNKTIYGQGTKQNPYLKFCKGNTQTAIAMQPFDKAYTKTTVSLDWAIHMTTSVLDVVDFQWRIEGDGHFANGTKASDIFVCKQATVTDPEWSHAVAEVFDVNTTTKISISSKTAFDGSFAASGQHRFYIDNILVTSADVFDNEPQPASGSTVYGIVECEGKGIANVVVSDGYEVVKTDADGVYQLKSAKKNGFVFISIPSGYEVAVNGVLPQFHKKLAKPADSVERVDFSLIDAGDQTNHTILYLGDMHMANRTSDKVQFRKFTSELAAYRTQHPSDKIYAITLGDMTWDLYWYSRNYCFEQYLNEYKGVVDGFPIFHSIGNHDHDMNAIGDWETMMRFRNAICPNYYSFNIGKIHYVVLDDIECTNKTASTSDGSVRQYNEKVVSDIINWLKKDLAYVSKTTPVVVTLHAPVYTKDGGNSLANASELTSALSGYNVTFVSGHTHRTYCVDKSSSIREYNSGAICAAWWWAGKYNQDFNIATDGAPAGYRITTVQGTKQTSYFKAIGKDASYQFRAYDRNQINFDVSMVPSSAQSAFRNELLSALIYGNYMGGSSSNDVIINVWDWNKNWKVEVTENGKALTVDQKTLMDPAFFIAYTIPHMNAGNNSVTWHPSATNNMFVVTASSATSTLTIKVTDDEGRVYTQQMKRPLEHTVANYTK